MSENVEKVDFGKEKREVARMMGRLLGIVEQRDADIIADPVKYWKMVMAQAGAFKRHIDEIEEAGRYPLLDCMVSDGTPTLMPRPVMVGRADFDRWRAMEEVIRRGPPDWRKEFEKPEGGA